MRSNDGGLADLININIVTLLVPRTVVVLNYMTHSNNPLEEGASLDFDPNRDYLKEMGGQTPQKIDPNNETLKLDNGWTKIIQGDMFTLLDAQERPVLVDGESQFYQVMFDEGADLFLVRTKDMEIISRVGGGEMNVGEEGYDQGVASYVTYGWPSKGPESNFDIQKYNEFRKRYLNNRK
jgi:hypothetical protein